LPFAAARLILSAAALTHNRRPCRRSSRAGLNSKPDKAALSIIMDLSPEQYNVIRRRVAADSPSPLCAYGLWLFFGFSGAHRFYLGGKKSGFALPALALGGLILAGLGIAFGGTPLDGLFYTPGLNDILRSSQSRSGLLLFGGGAALLMALLCCWAADIFAIAPAIARIRAQKQRYILNFYHKER